MNTEIICIIDKSGSMTPRAQDAVGGFNAFVEEQRKLGEASLTTVLFDTSWQSLYESMPISRVPTLTGAEYRPGGMTALLDAVGVTIDRMGKRFAKRDVVPPKKVIVAIITDGEENSSREYTAQTVKEKVGHQQSNYGWEFIYLGANQDAWAVGATIGIRSSDTYSWDSHTVQGVTQGYGVMAQAVSDYRVKDDD